MLVAMIIVSIAAFYKELGRELMKIPCIGKRFKKSVRSYTVTHDREV